jgi:hypothetical protein
MKEMELEKRMYFFVPYNISPIQQAIQAGHAALEYARKFKDDIEFIDFAVNWKTWIILNGGTTNSNRDFEGAAFGSLNQIGDSLLENKIHFTYFEEPDLNDALTAVCFIADERVFNYEDYPDFPDWIRIQDFVDEDEKLNSFLSLEGLEPDKLKELFPGMYPEWVRLMGGEKNLFLRELLRGKKLA